MLRQQEASPKGLMPSLELLLEARILTGIASEPGQANSSSTINEAGASRPADGVAVVVGRDAAEGRAVLMAQGTLAMKFSFSGCSDTSACMPEVACDLDVAAQVWE